MWLKLEAVPGMDIHEAIDKSAKIAKLLDVTIWFEFNGIQVGVNKNTIVNEKYQQWLKIQASERTHKII